MTPPKATKLISDEEVRAIKKRVRERHQDTLSYSVVLDDFDKLLAHIAALEGELADGQEALRVAAETAADWQRHAQEKLARVEAKRDESLDREGKLGRDYMRLREASSVDEQTAAALIAQRDTLHAQVQAAEGLREALEMLALAIAEEGHPGAVMSIRTAMVGAREALAAYDKALKTKDP